MTQTQTIGERLASVLQQPLFTFTFTLPEKKKPEPQETAKINEPKKKIEQNQNRQETVKTQSKQPSVKNAVPERKTSTGILMRNRNREDFEKVQFVLRACDKYSGRIFTEVLHIERIKNGSRLVATDGKRLHVAAIKTRIKPGDYKVTLTKDIIKLGKPVPNVNFPKWERVVPVNVVRRGCINLENTAIGNINRVCNLFTKLSGEKVNPKYLADLTKKLWVIYCQQEKQKAVILKEFYAAREMYAVLMPLSS